MVTTFYFLGELSVFLRSIVSYLTRHKCNFGLVESRVMYLSSNLLIDSFTNFITLFIKQLFPTEGVRKLGLHIFRRCHLVTDSMLTTFSFAKMPPSASKVHYTTAAGVLCLPVDVQVLSRSCSAFFHLSGHVLA